MNTIEIRERLAAGTISVADIISHANAIRLKLGEEEQAFKDRMKRPNAMLETLKNIIHEWFNANKAQNFKGTDGSLAFKQRKVSVSVADWDVAWEYIVKHDAYNFLNHSVNKTEVQAYVEANNTPPPGVNFTVTEEIQFRQPKKRGAGDADQSEEE